MFWLKLFLKEVVGFTKIVEESCNTNSDFHHPQIFPFLSIHELINFGVGFIDGDESLGVEGVFAADDPEEAGSGAGAVPMAGDCGALTGGLAEVCVESV